MIVAFSLDALLKGNKSLEKLREILFIEELSKVYIISNFSEAATLNFLKENKLDSISLDMVLTVKNSEVFNTLKSNFVDLYFSYNPNQSCPKETLQLLIT